MKTIIATLAVAFVAAVTGVAGVVYFGLINVGADDPHTGPVNAFLDTARNRSVEVRANDIEVPNLDNEAQIRAGAGNYDSMCVGCHLSPEAAQTELSEGLYPAPPNLAKTGIYDDPAKTFWVIKHGIKATGMPAWGKSMDDQYIWGMVAFIKQLPNLDARQYRDMVAASGGHQHGGGETDVGNHHGDSQAEDGGDHHGSSGADHHGSASPMGHSDSGTHAESSSTEQSGSDHHAPGSASDHHAPTPTPTTHTHADGKKHVHED
jgi:mono/diheme cytochrome c family protein